MSQGYAHFMDLYFMRHTVEWAGIYDALSVDLHFRRKS